MVHSRHRRTLAIGLIVLGIVILWLAPESPAGIAVALLGVVVELIGIALERRS